MTPTDVHRCTPALLADRCLPLIGCGLWLDREVEFSRVEYYLKALQPHHLDIVLDVALPETRARLDAVMTLCGAHDVAPWLYVICDDDGPETGLARLANWLEEAGFTPAGMLVTPRAYLKSHQPEGPWPDGADPEMVRVLARQYWPALALGGGFPTYFTELNRCRPDPDDIDFITHATSPLVHDADDRSVMETLESLPHIFKSAQALAPGCPYRITTSAIGAWINPYGSDPRPVTNDGTQRLTLSDGDPRQRGLMAAAWQAGYVAHAGACGVDALTLSSLGPPFDIAGRSPWPLFHVLRGLIRGGGQPLLVCPDAPSNVAAVGWQSPEGAFDELWLANLSAEPVSLAIQGVAIRAAALLDAHADPKDMLWMDHLTPALSPMTLPAFGVLRLCLSDPLRRYAT